MPANQYLTSLVQEREDIAAAIEGYANRAEERGADLSDEELAEVAQLQTRAAGIDRRLGAFGDAQQSNRAFSDLMSRLDTGQQRAEQRAQAAAAEQTSVGAGFVESRVYTEYREVPHGRSAVFEGELRAPTQTGGLIIDPARVVWPEPTEAFPLFGLTDVQTISSGSFEYVKYTWDDNAAVVAEGAVKPESTITEQLVTDHLDTIAHWTQLTRQALEDSARVRSVVDGKLTKGVLRKQHDSIGDALVAATLPAVTGGGDLLAAIRVGIGTVQAAGWAPNAVLLNPADWADLDIGIMGSTLNGPTVHQSFFGLRPVAHAGQAAGTATVGAFDEGLTLFRRSGVSVYATDSHDATFISNIITLLAEARSKAVVTDVSAFAECTAGVLAAAASSGSGSSKSS